MATLHKLAATGHLVLFEPLLDPGEQPERVIYMAPDAWKWTRSSTELGEQTPNPHSFDRVRAILSEFCAGKLMLQGLHIRQLQPRRQRIWEFKTLAERYSVRVFGWFYKPGCFIAAHCEYRKNVSKRAAAEIAVVERFRKNLPLDEPKVYVDNDFKTLLGSVS